MIALGNYYHSQAPVKIILSNKISLSIKTIKYLIKDEREKKIKIMISDDLS